MTIASARPKTGLTEVLSLRGPRALSTFRRERLFARLNARVPGVRGIDAEFWHFAALTTALAPAQAALLERLLIYGPKTATEPLHGEAIVVVPRLGTVSPWSSKATDIARQCGLAAVARLERGVVYYLDIAAPLGEDERAALLPLLHDRMTECVLADLSQAPRLFDRAEPQALRVIDVSGHGRAALEAADRELGLALSADEIDYLLAAFSRAGHNPTDVELMMFAQANSEHCRHKIFNAEWKVNGKRDAQSLFQMIQHTHAHSPRGTLVAYSDNAAVIEGPTAARFVADPDTRAYAFTTEPNHIVMKVETHNHPTAIAPHPGAATGSGGEIRDEGATGCGAKPKAGLTGFSVSNLRIPGAEQPWEVDHGKPARIVSALEIMLDGPLGGSAFNNEFGRPAIAGYFRTFELEVGGEIRGYHKPIMLAGGLGNIRAVHVHKRPVPPGAHILVIGGPAMLIGLGGGAASSVASGSGQEALDFASVQRANAEMQRRCQEVVDQCRALGADNPILSIHDVGAGGLSNAVPEILHGAGCGGRFDLRAVPNDQPGMSPMEIWCNEAQERYVVAVDDAQLARFLALCARERCPAAAIGTTTAEPRLVVEDPHFAARGERFARPIDVELALLFGKPPRMLREAKPVKRKSARFATGGIDLTEAAYRVLALPTVASKNFLITIGDRSVGGLVCRDQMVGPWQVPVADAGVTASGFRDVTGEAMAIGERAPLALIDPAASARMAIAEAITNIACARIRALGDVKLSANWMAAAGHPGEDAALHAAVRAAALELCPALGVSIPVGKDSLSMKTVWREGGEERAVVAPVSLVVSAFAPVVDVRKTITPQIKTDRGETDLLLVDFARGKNRVGGSVLAQVYGSVGMQAPDLDDPRVLKLFFALMQALNQLGLLLAYHDRSDGGLFVALCEMAFAGRTGVRVDVDDLGSDPVAALFAEEPGALLQTPRDRRDGILGAFREAGLLRYTRLIGEPTADDHVSIVRGPRALLREPRVALQRAWAETSYRMQALRDDPECAREEYDAILDLNDPGLNATLSFDPAEDVAAPFVNVGARPRVAILREQGVNGHVEMAAAFDRAGFEAHDVTMSDVIEGRVSLAGFKGLAACGGFSYGDVLGAGEGWAKAILFNARARDEFSAFFARPDTFGLGSCNGCQMMSNLREIIPGAEDWPHFVRNRSEQFEARTVLVTIPENHSILFAGMAGSRLPIVVAHGEGRAEFAAAERLQRALGRQLVALQFVDNHGAATERYPANPNGSPFGITGLTTPDGRFTVFMPHPERVFRSMSLSWAPSEWGTDSPWLRLFRNARAFVA